MRKYVWFYHEFLVELKPLLCSYSVIRLRHLSNPKLSYEERKSLILGGTLNILLFCQIMRTYIAQFVTSQVWWYVFQITEASTDSLNRVTACLTCWCSSWRTSLPLSISLDCACSLPEWSTLDRALLSPENLPEIHIQDCLS